MMKRISTIVFGCVVLLLNGTILAGFTPTADGLYAVFTTNKGEFTAQLEFEKVPLTVANFVGLAEGTRNWLDQENGVVRKERYYDGLTFHRVMSGFMIQGGSRNGLGTDGPGYRFKDEFDATLRHDSAGVLSMANSGVDTNGSQFFITLDDTDWLDDVHSVFGRIVEGLSVVQGIGVVATGANNKPVEDVIIERVDIVREGVAAEAFDENGPVFPSFRGVPSFEMEFLDGGIISMLFERKARATYTAFEYKDLSTWVRLGEIGFSDVDPSFRLVLVNPANSQDVLPKENGDGLFFRIVETDYTDVE